MSQEHDDHGNTVAAWTLVAIVIVGCTIGSVGFIVAQPPLVIVGTVVALLGVVVGKVLQMMGLGKRQVSPDA
ncbi:MAG TPA: hypothetical protein DHW34_04915 [Actinobacteria bacterium]|nr:hypothetical protein [Actinomycetota bacterium]